MAEGLRAQHGVTPSAPPVPAPGELEAWANRDIAELQAAAQEYEDSAEACDSPALAEFRVRRRTRAMRLLAIAERVAQLVATARESARLREALEQIAKGEGRYSRDPLTHAENTIADMTALAREALAARASRPMEVTDA